MKRDYLQLDGPSEAAPALTVVISRRGRPVVRLTAERQPRHLLAALWVERLQQMHERARDAGHASREV